jgi:hypothetical protein
LAFGWSRWIGFKRAVPVNTRALEFLVEGPAGKRRLIRFVAIDLILAPGAVFVRVAACEC